MRSELFALAAIFTVVNAVTITSYNSRGCRGNSRYCSNIGQGTCCYRQGGTYSSTKFSGLISSELGVICKGTANKKCQTTLRSHPGNGCINPPGPTQKIKGSLWVSCVNPRCPSSAAELTLLEGEEPTVIDTVLPDKISVDGHIFEINYQVPANATAQIEALSDVDARYEDVPDSLRMFEVTGDAAAEYLQ